MAHWKVLEKENEEIDFVTPLLAVPYSSRTALTCGTSIVVTYRMRHSQSTKTSRQVRESHKKENGTTITACLFSPFDPGFEWLNENVVLSGSKDGTLIQHAFKDAERPADTLPPVGMALNIRGDITYASCDSLMMTTAATTASNSMQGEQKKKKTIS